MNVRIIVITGLFAILTAITRADALPDIAQLTIWLQKEDTFWFKDGTSEETIWADESVRQQAVDAESRRTITSRQKYIYSRESLLVG